MSFSILVIDDDEDILETLQSLLVRKGYDAITANSGAAAIERSEESVINLALIDIMLPDMDFGIRDGEFVPFFGVPTATLSAPARIAAATNANVIPVITTYLPGYKGWKTTFYPAWENYPGDDILAATRRMNASLKTACGKLRPNTLGAQTLQDPPTRVCPTSTTNKYSAHLI